MKSITAFGETKSVIEWSKDIRCNVKYETLVLRLYRNQNPETAITSIVKLRKYTYDTKFFDSWSEDMAYVLGFITADGYIRNVKRSKYLRIKIKESDIDILNYIKKVINYSGEILHKQAIRKGKTNYSVILQINSTKLVEQLYKYGLIQNKTGKECLPNIPDKFKPDYLRGLFDGDGYVNHSADTRRFGIASANIEFLQNVKKVLCSNYGNFSVNKKKTCYSLIISQQKQMREIYKKMYYPNHPFSLERKRLSLKLF